jgi:hypothetical protein
MPSFNILLQTQDGDKEEAHRFYDHIGFQSCGFPVSRADLELELGNELTNIIIAQQQSLTDFVHFIHDEDHPLMLMKNAIGEFSKLKRSTFRSVPKQYDELTYVDSIMWDSFKFPFHSTRKFLLIVAAKLDLFYLPFHPGVDIDAFIRPNTRYNINRFIAIANHEREQMENPTAWLCENHIDFISFW